MTARQRTIGASRADISRLLDEGLLIVAVKTSTLTKYKLSEQGRKLVWATTMEREFTKIPTQLFMNGEITAQEMLDRWEAEANAILAN